MADPDNAIVKPMIVSMLEGARSADELHAAIDKAVELIEANPEAQYASQIIAGEVRFKDEGSVDGMPIGPAVFINEWSLPIELSGGQWITRASAIQIAADLEVPFVES